MFTVVIALFAFSWHDVDGRLELRDEGRSVISYNYRQRLENGAPEIKRRSGYVHPVWAPDGTVVTDDFPRDHWHHRGLFWAWPVVKHQGRSYDLWTLTGGIETRFSKWLEKTSGRSARLGVESAWLIEGKPVVKETVRIRVDPLHGAARHIHFEITLEPLVPIQLAGMQDGKGYGGFNARFAPRENTVVRTEAGVETKDTDLVPHPWAELEASYGDRRARLRITSDERNPGHPQGWCLRNYGFLGANYPGLEHLDMQPGKPLTLRYLVTVASVE